MRVLSSVVVLLFAAATELAAQERALHGRVVDEETGAPVRGARIMLSDQSTTRTDAEGRFEIQATQGSTTISVAKPGYVRTPGPGPRNGETLVVKLPPAAVLVVHVLDPTGEPKRATVRASGSGPNWSTSASVPSDDRGIARISGLRPGQYSVSAGVFIRAPLRELRDDEVMKLNAEVKRLSQLSAAEAQTRAAAIQLGARQEQTVYLIDTSAPGPAPMIDLREPATIKRASSIQGRVVQSDGRAVEGATVVASDSTRLLSSRAVSDSTGAFSIGNLPAGTFRVSAQKQGLAVTQSGRDPLGNGLGLPITLKDDEQRGSVVVTLAPAAEIQGTVRDEFGEPVERAMVLLFRSRFDTDVANALSRVGGGTSNDQGQYRIPLVAPGAYYLVTLGDTSAQGETYLFHPGVVSIRDARLVSVGEGQLLTEIDFRLNPALGVTITGSVVDSAGRPRTNTQAHLTGADSLGVPIEPRSALLDRTGSFTFRNVAAGEYAVAVRATPQRMPTVVNGQVVRDLPGASNESGSMRITVTRESPPPVTIRTSAP